MAVGGTAPVSPTSSGGRGWACCGPPNETDAESAKD